MKIKTFKNQIKNENYDIPNVLEKIKPIAYNTKYHVEERKHLFLKNLLQLVPVMTVFAICLLVLFNLDRTIPQDLPENPGEKEPYEGLIKPEDIYNIYTKNSEPNIAFFSEHVPSFNISKECHSDEYCMWVIDENDTTTLVVDEEIFNYLSSYINDNKECTLIDAVNNVKEKFSIPDEEIYAISDAYNYIKNSTK